MLESCFRVSLWLSYCRPLSWSCSLPWMRERRPVFLPPTVDKPWGVQTHFGYTGHAGCRRHIHFASLPGASSHLALILPPVDDSYQVYWNGNRIGQLGKMPPNPTRYRRLAAQIIGLGPPRSGVRAEAHGASPLQFLRLGRGWRPQPSPWSGIPSAIAAFKATTDLSLSSNAPLTRAEAIGLIPSSSA